MVVVKVIMVDLSSKRVPENHVFQNSLSLFKTSTLYNINCERVVKKLNKDLHLDSHSWLTSWLGGRLARCPSEVKRETVKSFFNANNLSFENHMKEYFIRWDFADFFLPGRLHLRRACNEILVQQNDFNCYHHCIFICSDYQTISHLITTAFKQPEHSKVVINTPTVIAAMFQYRAHLSNVSITMVVY